MIAMTHRGIARGTIIELDDAIDLPEGTPVEVSVKTISGTGAGALPPGELARFLRAEPGITSADAATLMHVILEGRQPTSYHGIFDHLTK
jgi:hypothetical protein